MNTNLEIEYKTLLSKEEYNQILNYFEDAQMIEQTNYYYQSKKLIRVS